jgi:hypothetical protein
MYALWTTKEPFDTLEVEDALLISIERSLQHLSNLGGIRLLWHFDE